ncbi:MAG: bifunctional pyr operon transcriptional regulator/uracil phosphoribosyltransferase PyrR [Bacteroidetes bacterium]|nr:bifunctional pyr operon transcriptional regulator/uracil phosphoribosyltransferase PyrR [Bacteroidota bacterium]
MASAKIVLNTQNFEITLTRLCHQLIETHNHFEDTAIIGLQPRGVFLSKRLHKQLMLLTKNKNILCGELDTTFYRDDFRQKELIPNQTNIPFIIENKNVVLVDDVLFTGRSIRAGLDALLAFGRPKKVELLVLIDRRFSRHLPIQPNYVGKTIDSIETQNVKVEWSEIDKTDKVTLIDK